MSSDRDSENLERIRELLERQYEPESTYSGGGGDSPLAWLGCLVPAAIVIVLLSTDSLFLWRAFESLVHGFVVITGGR